MDTGLQEAEQRDEMLLEENTATQSKYTKIRRKIGPLKNICVCFPSSE
jgi:hypothetical protein